MKIYNKILVFIITFFCQQLYAQDERICFCDTNTMSYKNYFGINDFGKLMLCQNGTFYYKIRECTTDIGRYTINGDTIFLTTINQPFKVISKKDSTLSKNYFLINLYVYDKYGGDKLIEKRQVKYDKTENKVIINNCNFLEGQFVQLEMLNRTTYKWQNNTINNCLIDVLSPFDNTFLNKFPLIMKDDYLLPFDNSKNIDFYRENGYVFVPMKFYWNKKYNLYNCTLMEVR